MKKFLNWFKRFELKRRLLFLSMILYALVSIGSLVIKYYCGSLGLVYFICYCIGGLFFMFQYIYVEITDVKEYEKKLFKKE